jgi:uncharacterized Zn-binding protein involved in type VI secretion
MGQPAAKQGDEIRATDFHLVNVPGTPPTALLPHEFSGIIGDELSSSVRIEGRPAATVGSTADAAAHIPTPPGTSFQKPPANLGTIVSGSPTVRIGSRAAARHGDSADTCNDPTEAPIGIVIASGSVRIG